MRQIQRRKLKPEIKKQAVKLYSESDIIKIKQQITKDVVDKAFMLMLAIPTMVIHDYYPKIMKKEVEGKNREERFVEMCLDMYDGFDKGYFTLNEAHECLQKEAGITIQSLKKQIEVKSP